MRERPIIMSGQSSRSIRAKLKTHTRRVIKPQLDHFHDFSDGMGWRPQIGEKEIRCPYGQVGDRLWVKEVWAALGADSLARKCMIAYRAEGELSPSTQVHHKSVPLAEWRKVIHLLARKWRSPLFMPRWACRTVLEIVSINVERLHDITDEGARLEGVAWDCTYMGKCNSSRCPVYQRDPLHVGARQDFARLWDSINAKRGHPWIDNPWVWDIGFKLVEQEP